MTEARHLARAPVRASRSWSRPASTTPFTALVATQAGFETLYVSGAAIAYTRLGRPDIGLVSMSEVAETIALIRDRVDAHLIVDADTGYGNALNVVRTVRAFERAGASAIQLEDQDFPKRCGHLDGKALIPADEMVGKIKAALDARALARHADHRAHRCGRGRGLRARDRARRALSARPAPTCCSSRRRRRARNSRASSTALPRRAADGQHGGRRQDADPVRAPSSKRSASRW